MISKDKQYRTKDGREVRIYATDAGGDYPVHGAVRNSGDREWWVCCWSKFGNTEFEQLDLIEYKPRIKGWLNFYDGVVATAGPGAVHPTRDMADSVADHDRIACIEVDIEYGEGISDE